MRSWLRFPAGNWPEGQVGGSEERWCQGRTVPEISGQLLRPTRDILLFGCAINEAGDVGLQLGEIFVPQIHHVSRVVILQMNVFLQLFRQAQVLHGVFGGEEWSRQVV